MATTSMSKHRQKGGDETKVRERILEAAFRAFRKSGYATTSTLEIATRARVSKRELYELGSPTSASARSDWTYPLTCPCCAIARPWSRCWLLSGRSSSAR